MTHYTSYNSAAGEFWLWRAEAAPRKTNNQRDEHYTDDFTAIQNIWGFYRKGTRGCRAQSLHMQEKQAHDLILVFGPTSEHLGYFHTQLHETHLERYSASTPPLI